MQNLIRTTLFVTIAVCSSYADYISVKAKVGSYVLDSKEDTTKSTLIDKTYQYHSLNAAIEKNGIVSNVSWVYSDLYKSRGGEYRKDYRLSLANVGYKTADNTFQGSVGRHFTGLIDRTVWWDGADVQYTIADFAVNGFGGYVSPTLYADDLIQSDSEFLTFGGSLSYSGIKDIVVIMDYLKANDLDDGTIGLGVLKEFNDRYSATANGVWGLTQSGVDHIDVGFDATIRASDKIMVTYSFDDSDVDTTKYYDMLTEPTSHLVEGGYYAVIDKNISAVFNYGLLLYSDETAVEDEDTDKMGHIVDLEVRGYGAYIGYTKEIESASNSQEIVVGYEKQFCKRVTTGINGGYMTYVFQDDKKEKDAYFGALNVEYMIVKQLHFSAEYAYLHNRQYNSDNRVFVGLTYSMFKGL